MCRVISRAYFVAKTLRCDNGNLITDTLVGLEIESELWVVPLDYDLCGLFDGLRTHATLNTRKLYFLETRIADIAIGCTYHVGGGEWVVVTAVSGDIN